MTPRPPLAGGVPPAVAVGTDLAVTWLGTALRPSVPAAGLRPALGCVLLAAALGVLSKAGVSVPATAIVGVPLAMGLAAHVLHRLRTPAREVVTA